MWAHRQGLVLGSQGSPLPPSVLSACVTHTDGNNFFQLLEAGEACSLHSRGVSLSRPPFGSTLAVDSLSSCPPSLAAAFLIPRRTLGGWGLAFLNRVSVSLSHRLPLSSVLVLPCDGNVLVNCITNLLCVYVCLWGWFIVLLATRPLCLTIWSLSRPGTDS